MKLVIEVKEEDYKRYKEDKICSYTSAVLDAVPLNEVLDEIRAEIEQMPSELTADGRRMIRRGSVFRIIEKYRKEIAMTKQEDEQINFDGVFCDKSAMKKLGCLGNCIGCTHWTYDEDAKRKRCINPKIEKLKGDSE